MNRKSIPTTYDEAREMLNPRAERTIANNTRLRLHGSSIGLILHNTEVVTFNADGSIVLKTGGYETVTTKDRLNRVARAHGWNIYAEKHVWHIAHRSGATFEFGNGFTIPPATRAPEPTGEPYVTAVIKGDKFTAASEAAKRGIPAVFVREGANSRETVIRMSLEHRDAVARWFGEHGECEQGRGFADGTCLIFSTHEADQSAEAVTDARVENHGTIFLVRPLTESALAWLTEHTDGTWFGNALTVEHRYVADLVAGLRDSGFTVEPA